MKCPKCSREIVNRRKERCDFCNFALPPEFKFTDDQQRKLDEMNRAESKRHSAWKSTDNEPFKGNLGSGGIDFTPP